MSDVEETFSVVVGNETYTVTRVLQSETEKTATYRFKTVIDGNEVGLSAKLETATAQDLHEELSSILLNEFKLEIEKIKKGDEI